VHAIDSWADLRQRVEPEDRRCFAFFHPAMPDEPLIFVEVALTRGIPGAIAPLLEKEREVLPASEADTAVFYSISNCQAGLASISFGNSLIKQVAADLGAEVPGVKRFVTLSPIPGLMGWAKGQGISVSDAGMPALAAYYLTQAKTEEGTPVDPVARFHLGNGATIHALHGQADLSDKGRAQSGGVMVNYLYDLRKHAQHHEAYASNGTIAASSEVRALATRAPFGDEVSKAGKTKQGTAPKTENEG
jgi:malonyl-CoA decarboxylase